MTATVTVCIPAYRAASFIAQTVIGVLRQTHSDLRVVVAIDPPDDGSPCGTATALAPPHGRPQAFGANQPKAVGLGRECQFDAARCDHALFLLFAA